MQNIYGFRMRPSDVLTPSSKFNDPGSRQIVIYQASEDDVARNVIADLFYAREDDDTDVLIGGQSIDNAIKEPAELASLVNININVSPDVYDGVSATAVEATISRPVRLLINNQTTSSENGLYNFNGTGNPLTRVIDADMTSNFKAGMLVVVTEGNTLADTLWELVTDDPIIIGTSSIHFINITGATVVFATEVESRQGVILNKSMSPARTRQAIQEGAFMSVDGQISNNLGNSDVLCNAPNGGLDSIQANSYFVCHLSSGAQSNTGTNVTLTIAPIGAKPLMKIAEGGNLVALSVDDLVKGHRIFFQYDIINDVFVIIAQSQIIASLIDMSTGIFNVAWPVGSPVNNRLVTPRSVRQGIQSGLAFNEYIFGQSGSNFIGTNDYNATTDQFVDDYIFSGVFGSSSVGNDTMSIVTTTSTQGPYALRKQDGAGNFVPLAAGDIQAGGSAFLLSDLGNNRIILMTNGVISTFPASMSNLNPYFDISGDSGAIDLSGSTYMKTLSGNDHQFANKTSLNLNGLTLLKDIDLTLSSSTIPTIDLSTLSSLIRLFIDGDAALTSMPLPTLKTALQHFRNTLSNVPSFDFTGFINMLTLVIQGNNSLTSVNITNNNSLSTVTLTNNPGLTTLTYNASDTQLLLLNMINNAFNDATALGNLIVQLDSNGLLNGLFDISGGSSVGATAIFAAVPASSAATTSLLGKGWTINANA